jgi:hypothetical protein
MRILGLTEVLAVLAFGALSACDGSATPSIKSTLVATTIGTGRAPAIRLKAASRTKVWGVGASGYMGGFGGNPFLFAYCDTTIYLQYPDPGCMGQYPYDYGKRSMSVQYNATAPCTASGGTCSGALSTALSLGKLAVSTSVTVSANPSDPGSVQEGSEQVSSFIDQITVASSTSERCARQAQRDNSSHRKLRRHKLRATGPGGPIHLARHP